VVEPSFLIAVCGRFDLLYELLHDRKQYGVLFNDVGFISHWAVWANQPDFLRKLIELPSMIQKLENIQESNNLLPWFDENKYEHSLLTLAMIYNFQECCRLFMDIETYPVDIFISTWLFLTSNLYANSEMVRELRMQMDCEICGHVIINICDCCERLLCEDCLQSCACGKDTCIDKNNMCEQCDSCFCDDCSDG